MSSSSGDGREAPGPGEGLWTLGTWGGRLGLGRWSHTRYWGQLAPRVDVIPSPALCILRCELSVEKSTVLQSELESCKELQELEPENKCEAPFPDILLF